MDCAGALVDAEHVNVAGVDPDERRSETPCTFGLMKRNM